MSPDQTLQERFAPFATKMQQAGQSELARRNFFRSFGMFVEGDLGLIPESSIQPAEGLRHLSELECHDMVDMGRDMLKQTIHILLNGGLGTSMGLTGPKALIEAKDGRTFLDLQIQRAQQSGMRLLFMHSQATRQACMAEIQKHMEPSDGLPLDFVQHMVPRIDAETRKVAHWPDNPELEWCPPGHGDLYCALLEDDLLGKLIEAGYRYAFISNVDNLAAWPDPRILGYMYVHGTEFLMETARRAEADRKGGHLAQRPDGSFLLRERAQCPAEDILAFEDTDKHRYFNTNNLWVDLGRLGAKLDQSQGLADLPIIVNEKPIDPLDPGSPRVVQLESAAGAAVSWFAGSEAIEVDRSRFAPVKTTADLLTLRSDAVELTKDGLCIPAEELQSPPDVRLDPRHHRTVEGLDRAFPKGPPSLRHCRSLKVRGDVRFGANVVVQGRVTIEAPSGETLEIPDGTVLTGD